jgi:hypothetical protein
MRFNGPLTKRVVDRVNGLVTAVRSSRRLGALVRDRITIASYTGRRSGRRFSIPVGYRRTADTVTIGVQMPDAKTWWRNFLDEGGPITLELDGADRPGHAIARRDGAGRVTVTVQLTPDPAR